MASPVGHSLCGISLYLLLKQRGNLDSIKKDWRVILLFVILANIPDIDFLIGMIFFGHANAIHGTITHSILFALVGSVVVALIYRSKSHEAFLGILYASMILIVSHDLIDVFSAKKIGFYTSGEGAALFYPFIGHKIHSPLALFYGIGHKDFAQLTSIRNLWTIVFEILIFIPIKIR